MSLISGLPWVTSHPNTPNTMFLQKSSLQNLQGIIKRPNRLINTTTNNQNFINTSFGPVRSEQRINLIRVFYDRAARWGTAFMPSLCNRFATATVSIGSDPGRKVTLTVVPGERQSAKLSILAAPAGVTSIDHPWTAVCIC